MIRTTNLSRFFAAALIASALAFPVAGCGPATDAKSPAGDAGAAEALVGKPAPDFSADSVMGEGPKNLKDAKGTVVILDFWATYCGPCKKSFPKYQEIVNQFGGDVTVIAVATDGTDDITEDTIKDFVKETGVQFGVAWDKTKAGVKLYSPPTMPTSFIIDKEGIVRHVHAGFKGDEPTTIQDEIKALLGK